MYSSRYGQNWFQRSTRTRDIVPRIRQAAIMMRTYELMRLRKTYWKKFVAPFPDHAMVKQMLFIFGRKELTYHNRFQVYRSHTLLYEPCILVVNLSRIHRQVTALRIELVRKTALID